MKTCPWFLICLAILVLSIAFNQVMAGVVDWLSYRRQKKEEER